MHELEYENLCCCCIFCLKCWSFHFTVLLITSHLLSERYTDVLKKAAALEAANWDDRSPASSSLSASMLDYYFSCTKDNFGNLAQCHRLWPQQWKIYSLRSPRWKSADLLTNGHAPSNLPFLCLEKGYFNLSPFVLVFFENQPNNCFSSILIKILK